MGTNTTEMTTVNDELGFGRILAYEIPEPDEKINSFKQRVEEQIASLRIAIKVGSVNDPEIAENYAKKLERFLSIPYFIDRKNKDKRVRGLKKYLKISVSVNKDLSAIIEEWLVNKRRAKLVVADKYIPFTESKGFNFCREMADFYNLDDDFFTRYQTSYASERIVVNRLIGIFSDKSIVDLLGIKNSWKVSNLKKMLQANRQCLVDISDDEFAELLALPYFKYKKYLILEVRELKELLDIRSQALLKLEEWVESRKTDASMGIYYSKEDAVRKANTKTLKALLKEYDEFLVQWAEEKKKIDNEYSLYRFGQGLIEADIFDSLYK